MYGTKKYYDTSYYKRCFRAVNLADLSMHCFQAFLKCYHRTCQLVTKKIKFKIQRPWTQSETSPGLDRIDPLHFDNVTQLLANLKEMSFEVRLQNY